jgi:outer membrane murein-binding lipoprotein Lpp
LAVIFEATMKVILYILTLMITTFGCEHTNKDNSANTNHDTLLSKKDSLAEKVDTAKINLTNNHSDTSKNWADSLIKNYIIHSDNKLIRLALKDKISEEWLFDQIIKTDTAKYFVFQIGHDVMDSGETNKRFITDVWVYIDSLTKTIYEYDLPNDRLVRRNK